MPNHEHIDERNVNKITGNETIITTVYIIRTTDIKTSEGLKLLRMLSC